MADTTFAIVFPGQGSQSVGMLKALAEAHAVVADTFAEASERLGYDLWQRVQEGPAEALDQTHVTQPAMLAAGVAVWRVWRNAGGGDPRAMAGHSLGEYTALTCADAIDFADAVALVAERGRLMQAAVPPGEGAMAAILGLDDDTVRALCVEAAEDEVVEAVNFNSPGQVVVAGAAGGVERLIELARAAGAKRALKLAVSVPSHCALMKPAAEKLAEELGEVDMRMPRLTVLHNVTVAPARDVVGLRENLARQLYSPVRWGETVGQMAAEGVDTVLELGPGRVLTGLTRRIDRRIKGLAVYDPASLDKALEAVQHAE